MDTLAQQLANGIILGSVYALIALGYTMVYGILGLINFAHGEVTMMGAMIAIAVLNALLASTLALPPFACLGIALIISIPACCLLGMTIEQCTTASPTDYCYRCFHRVTECSDDDLGARLPTLS